MTIAPSRRAFLISAAALALRPASLFADPETVAIATFSPAGEPLGVVSMPRISKTDDEWRAQLSPLAYKVTRRSGTEGAFTGSLLNQHQRGIFHCICCDIALFSSRAKYDSGTGWPSFFAPIAHENVADDIDNTRGMRRTAVSCRLCDAHLGHVFDDGPKPTGLRYCINSVALSFVRLIPADPDQPNYPILNQPPLTNH